MSTAVPARSRLETTCVLFVAALYIAHLVIVLGDSVNIPAVDEWESLRPGHLAWSLNWDWVFATHNEHRVVPTKLLAWLLYRWTSWNINTHILLNFSLYCAAVWAWVRLYARIFQFPAWVGMLPFATSIAYEDIAVTFQTQFNFFILFYALAVAASVTSKKRRYIGLWWIALCVVSFSAGVACAFGLLLTHALIAIRWPERRRHALIHVGFIGLLIGVWLATYSLPLGSAATISPISVTYWQVFFRLVGHAFGYSAGSGWAGGIFIAIGAAAIASTLVAGPPSSSADAERLSIRRRQDTALALGLGAFGAVNLILLGRSGDFSVAETSRYIHVAMLLVPLILGAGWCSLRRGKAAVYQRLAWLFLGLSVLPYANHCDFPAVYAPGRGARREGVRCMRRYFNGLGPATCPTIYPDDMKELFDRAQELRTSFYLDAVDQS